MSEYCKSCGRPHPNIHSMVNNRCTKNSAHNGYHNPAR